MSTKGKGWYAAAGIAAVAAVIGLNEVTEQAADPNLKYVQVSKHSAALEREEIHLRKKGEEIKSKRTANMEVFKADETGVKFQAKIYSSPKYFYDVDGDSLQALDLTERDIDALAKDDALKSEKKHDRYIKAGPYKATWFTGKKHDYKIYSGDGTEAVKFTELHSMTAMTVTTVPNSRGVKQTWTLADSTAATTLRWLVESTSPMIHQGGAVKAGAITIEKPVAWDADGADVPVAVSVSGDTLTYTVFDGAARYPVTVDPTTTVVNGAQSGYIYTTNANYATGRNKTTGDAVQLYTDNDIFMGQYLNSGNYENYRNLFHFSIPSMSACLACTLYAYGTLDFSTTDFEVQLYGARSARSVLTTADVKNFDGWQASGAYNGTRLNNVFSTASFVTSAYNKIILNTAGLDSVAVAKGDTLWMMMISSRDSSGTAPSGAEMVRFSQTGAGHDNYLSFTYTVPSISAPTNFLITPIGRGDSLRITVTPNSTPDSLILYQWPDSVRVASLLKTGSDFRVGGLNPYQKYRWYIRADSAGVYGYSNVDSCYTLQTFKTENFPLINEGYAQNAATAVYDSARGETKADSLANGATYLGQWWYNASTKYVMRHYQDFALPKLTRVQAESLFVSGVADSSYTDFTINARAGTWNGGTVAKMKFTLFDGWQTQMTPYTGSALITPYSTAGFTTGATLNKLVFTAAGRDTTLKHGVTPDTLRIMLLSSRDISATAPTQGEYITMTEALSYLRLTYAPPDTIPTGFTLTAIAADSVLATWTDRSYTERGFVVWDVDTSAKVAGTDTTANDVTSLRIGGLNTNTKYRFQVKAVGGDVASTLTAPDSCYTLAEVPGAPTITFPTATLMKFTIDVNGNPSYTEFAVQDSITGKYVYPIAGPDSFGTAETWGTYAAFGGAAGDSVAVLTGKKYTLRVKARSGQ